MVTPLDTKTGPKTSPPGHTCASSFAYAHSIMRGAFVVQLAPQTKPSDGQFEGWVQEVDSCIELRFRSSEELLKFIGLRFEIALASAGKARTGGCEQAPIAKKSVRKQRSSGGDE